ncbi:hypothetical protein C5167_007163 [Papaver somniferum]|uniref:Uncharacterized protein n=1 Tax=Papaver somniferum TaxID=3469 RepID=A0A4Y7JJ90_PAPSO|nr:uncharacterized protein LOC113271741 isoform X1 [Papaver somniferum]RZC59858.1 hypothetical protein C5167_007163 [Papaver somniferum]
MHNKSKEFVLRSVASSNGVIKSEAVASISQDGIVMANVRRYQGDLLLSKASVNQTSSTKAINASIISNKKVMAMATVYRDGVREVVAKEVDDDDKENQGFPRLSLPKKLTTSKKILKEKESQWYLSSTTHTLTATVPDLRSVAWSNGEIKSEAIVSISQEGEVMVNVRPYVEDTVSSRASVIHKSSSKAIRAGIISNKKVMAMATVYHDGDREVVAKEVGDGEEVEENQGCQRLLLQKKSTTSKNFSKEEDNQGFLSSITHTRTATTSSSSPATTTITTDPDHLEKLIRNLCLTLVSGSALNPLGRNLWPGVGTPRPATSTHDQSSDGEADADAPRKW